MRVTTSTVAASRSAVTRSGPSVRASDRSRPSPIACARVLPMPASFWSQYGDLITFHGETGVVEDMRLSYTYVRTDDGRRLIVPNEQLAQDTVQNHTIVDPRVRVEVSVWIDRNADPIRALTVLRGEQEVDVSIAEIDKDGVRLVAGT